MSLLREPGCLQETMMSHKGQHLWRMETSPPPRQAQGSVFMPRQRPASALRVVCVPDLCLWVWEACVEALGWGARWVTLLFVTGDKRLVWF